MLHNRYGYAMDVIVIQLCWHSNIPNGALSKQCTSTLHLCSRTLIISWLAWLTSLMKWCFMSTFTRSSPMPKPINSAGHNIWYLYAWDSQYMVAMHNKLCYLGSRLSKMLHSRRMLLVCSVKLAEDLCCSALSNYMHSPCTTSARDQNIISTANIWLQ